MGLCAVAVPTPCILWSSSRHVPYSQPHPQPVHLSDPVSSRPVQYCRETRGGGEECSDLPPEYPASSLTCYHGARGDSKHQLATMLGLQNVSDHLVQQETRNLLPS